MSSVVKRPHGQAFSARTLVEHQMHLACTYMYSWLHAWGAARLCWKACLNRSRSSLGMQRTRMNSVSTSLAFLYSRAGWSTEEKTETKKESEMAYADAPRNIESVVIHTLGAIHGLHTGECAQKNEQEGTHIGHRR